MLASAVWKWLVKKLTVFAGAYFFSVPRMAPERAAALMADLPLMTFTWSPPPAPPLALLPMRVTLSQSWSAMLRQMGLFDLGGVQMKGKVQMAVGLQLVVVRIIVRTAKSQWLSYDLGL
jgi:hypothetical protein